MDEKDFQYRLFSVVKKWAYVSVTANFAVIGYIMARWWGLVLLGFVGFLIMFGIKKSILIAKALSEDAFKEFEKHQKK